MVGSSTFIRSHSNIPIAKPHLHVSTKIYLSIPFSTHKPNTSHPYPNPALVGFLTPPTTLPSVHGVMQGITKPPPSSSLAEVVCAWSPKKLSELAKTYSDSCSPPEIAFSSYDSYRAYFEPLLLAEVAADLLSTSEKFQRSKPARQPKVRARREEPGTNVALVTVGKVTRQHSWGFGWAVDIDSRDRKGPVGCIDNDVVVLWPSDPSQILPKQNRARSKPPPASRVVPDTAVHAVVVRTPTRTGCRLVLSKFPDGNEQGIRTDLEDGEENEDAPPTVRVWNLLRLGSLTTMKREFDALQTIRNSVLLPILLRPNAQQASSSDREKEDIRHASAAAAGEEKSAVQQERASSQFRNEQNFTYIIANKTGLNASQARAILHASTCRNGFSVIQGPPGTGKTRTLISLLNVIHMTQYQEYYEGLLASFASLHGTGSQVQSDPKEDTSSAESRNVGPEKGSDGGFLSSMLLAMSRTFSMVSESKLVPMSKRARRPRLLICAPSNSAVDEILTRLTSCRFVDGQGRGYCPELARIGAGDRVSEAAKSFTAEGQAETFLDRMCAEDMNPEAQKKAQTAFLTTWQNRCNSLLVQLARTPKKQPSSHPAIIDLHEKLERMDRDLRRLSIAASDGKKALTREEKLRQIARTYVEDAQLVFSTLSGAASSILTKKAANDMTGGERPLFDTVVIDEGAQATEPSCLIPMALGATRCLLVGDPQQLPATVLSSGAAGLAYGQSLLERVCKGGQNVQLLDTQYRMHPAISSFPRRYFYQGRLVDDESVQGDNRARPYHRDEIRPKLGPYVFLDIADGEEMRSRDDRSIFNRSEAELASLIYTKLKKEYPKDPLFSAAAKVQGSVTGFGVVTPYKRQMQELRQSFDRAGIPTGDVEINTVDSFQGREKDVIVFSCVRTASANRGIGFVRDVRRMNVGLTRARSSLIILGSAQALAEGSADWAELVEDASSRGCLISVSDVGRCLLPPAPQRDRLAISQAEKTPEESNKTLAGIPGPGTPNGNASVASDKNFHSAGPVDPRRRAPKRALSSEPNSKMDHPLPIHAGGPVTVSHHSDVTMAVPLQLSEMQRDQAGPQPVLQLSEVQRDQTGPQPDLQLPEMQRDQGGRQPGNASASDAFPERNGDLQSTLDQMSNVLADAGFQNVSAIKETLREHVRNGGALELEAIMAATVTNEDSSSKSFAGARNQLPGHWQQPVAAVAEAAPGHDRPVALVDERHANNDVRGIEARNVAKSEKQKAESEVQSNDPKPVTAVPSEQVGFSERNTKTKRGGGRGRVPKANGRDKSHDKKRDKAEGGAPSGWDMLFSNKNGSSGGKVNDVETKESRSASEVKKEEGEDAQQSNNAKTEAVPSETIEDHTGKQTEAMGTTPTTPKSSEDNQAKGKEQSEPINSKSQKNWNENGREFERKRQRTGDYGAGGSARGGYRGGRGRGRSKRGRGRGNFPYEQRGHDGYVNHEPWASPQYDSGFIPYQVASDGIDPGMGSTHGIDAMQLLQQQHAMQQVFQQQALQQQALQQQLHQQAVHQEAMMQQAAMMQLPGGIPMAALPPQAYQIGFDGNAISGNQRGQERGQRDEGRNYSGRGHRGARGRPRMKYGNRNRRDG